MTQSFSKMQGVLNGVLGDTLVETSNKLAIDMKFYHDGKALALDHPIGTQLPHPLTNKLVIFIHGLTNTESIWNFTPRTLGLSADSYGTRLQHSQGYTPLYLRYNSGLSIKENGLALSKHLESLCEIYPLPIDELVLVGFSMGGLLVRHAQLDKGRNWLKHLTACAYIGTPHAGAPLERAGKIVSAQVAELSKDYLKVWHPWAELRSQGIKDLHSGIDAQKDEFKDDIHHCFISGSIIKNTNRLFAPLQDKLEAKFIGDVLVPKNSAQPRAQLTFKSAKHFEAIDHLTLAHSERVYAYLSEWLEQTSSNTTQATSDLTAPPSAHSAPQAAQTKKPNKARSQTSDDTYLIDAIRISCHLGQQVTRTTRTMHDSISDEYYTSLNKIALVNGISRPVQQTHKAISKPVFAAVEQSFVLSNKLLGSFLQLVPESSKTPPKHLEVRTIKLEK